MSGGWGGEAPPLRGPPGGWPLPGSSEQGPRRGGWEQEPSCPGCEALGGGGQGSAACDRAARGRVGEADVVTSRESTEGWAGGRPQAVRDRGAPAPAAGGRAVFGKGAAHPSPGGRGRPPAQGPLSSPGSRCDVLRRDTGPPTCPLVLTGTELAGRRHRQEEKGGGGHSTQQRPPRGRPSCPPKLRRWGLGPRVPPGAPPGKGLAGVTPVRATPAAALGKPLPCGSKDQRD